MSIITEHQVGRCAPTRGVVLPLCCDPALLVGGPRMPAAADAARQKAQDSLNKQRQENKQLNSQQQQLQSKLLAAEQASEQGQRQVWELEKTRAGLAEQVTKLTSDVEFMEGEMTGLRDQLLASTEQVSGIIAQLFVAMYSLCWASQQKVTRHVHNNSTYTTWVHLHISVEFAGQLVTAQGGHHSRVVVCATAAANVCCR